MSKYKDTIWILAFEYAGVKKVGGLAEVPANQATSLKDHYNFQVFVPSHGQLKRIKKNHQVQKLPIECSGKLKIYTKNNNSLITGVYKIGFYQFELKGVTIILLKGENGFTEHYLDDNGVYNPETFEAKLALYAKGMRCYMNSLIDTEQQNLPNIIHLHDYHVVIPFISIKQELFSNHLDIPSIITIHLLTWPRYELDFLKNCGIDETPVTIRLKDGMKVMNVEEIFELCRDSKSEKKEKPPTMEKIGAVISDLVISVSKSYLESDIIPNLGEDLINFKSDFVWNGCDWDYYEMKRRVIDNLGTDIREYLNIPPTEEISRENMRNYLLTHKIGNLDQSPLINSEKILNIINQISNCNPFVKNGRIRAFDQSGPLALSTGRLSKQKGFELILDSIPEIIKEIPNAKFLFLILPTEYSLDKIKEYSKYVKMFPDNLRIIFGVASDIFDLAHLSADVYCAVSRWEPFGIIALEAMASKLPIIATKVGGLQESVIDIREDAEDGTGLLIKKDDKQQFINAIVSLFRLSIIDNKNTFNKNIPSEIIEEIHDQKIRTIVKENPNYYSKIEENCYKRVENNFRWEQVSEKLITLYNQIKELHKKS